MARRAIWKGLVSFGMVAIPVKLYTATESKDIAFVTLHRACNTRLRHRRFCPAHEMEVEPSQVARAYEFAKEQYVVMEEGDFDNLPVPSAHTIEITQFCDLSSIDPISFQRTYVLEPDAMGIKPFYLMKQALENTNRVALAKVSLRQKEHICCLRPFEHGLTMHTMFYPDEIRGNNELDLPEERTSITEAEMAMATMLIDQLTAPYDAAGYQDEYRLALERVIEGKLGAQMPVAPAPVAPARVTDLMEALRASVAAAKKQRPIPAPVDETAPPPASRRRTEPASSP